jgi:hypothetical protein
MAVLTGSFEDLQNFQINLRSGEQRLVVALRLHHPERMHENRYRDDESSTQNHDSRQSRSHIWRPSLRMTALHHHLFRRKMSENHAVRE